MFFCNALAIMTYIPMMWLFKRQMFCIAEINIWVTKLFTKPYLHEVSINIYAKSLLNLKVLSGLHYQVWIIIIEGTLCPIRQFVISAIKLLLLYCWPYLTRLLRIIIYPFYNWEWGIIGYFSTWQLTYILEVYESC